MILTVFPAVIKNEPYKYIHELFFPFYKIIEYLVDISDDKLIHKITSDLKNLEIVEKFYNSLDFLSTKSPNYFDVHRNSLITTSIIDQKKLSICFKISPDNYDWRGFSDIFENSMKYDHIRKDIFINILNSIIITRTINPIPDIIQYVERYNLEELKFKFGDQIQYLIHIIRNMIL